MQLFFLFFIQLFIQLSFSNFYFLYIYYFMFVYTFQFLSLIVRHTLQFH